MELREQLVHEVAQVGGDLHIGRWEHLQEMADEGPPHPERSKPGIFQDFQAVSG